MTDVDLVRKKLALIETLVKELRTLARPERIEHDVREERFVEHTLQIAIQATLDVASHIVSSERLGEPRTHRALFDLLERHDWISEELSRSLRDAAGFRNLLVHQYGEVQVHIVREVAEHRLDDFLRFAASVRARIPG